MNPLSNTFVFLLLLLFVIVVVLLFAIVMIVKKFRQKVLELLTKLKEKLIWNGIINTIVITYLKNFVSFFLAIKSFKYMDESESKASNIILLLCLGVPIVFYPAWSAVFLIRNKDKLQD